MDGATSDHPGVAAQLARLALRGPGRDILGLERITALLARLGNPHHAMPPVFHVAGTNGKGSTCAFLRAMLEAGGYRVHAFTSPHLVRFNERIRIASTLITDDDLAATLARVLDVAEGLGASFFEITTAAAFLRFAEEPADACVIEVGLGGRLDATNVIARPLVCGIASIGIDHEAFLLAPEAGVPELTPIDRIAFEKAGIAKAAVPLVTMGERHAPSVRATIAAIADAAGAPLFECGRGWTADAGADDHQFHYREDAGWQLHCPRPAMPGDHQVANAALAIAMLRRQAVLPVTEVAMQSGIASARWPARLQLLRDGPLAALARGRVLWLDGGHNADAGIAIARHFGRLAADTGKAPPQLHVIVGMLANKDAAGFLDPLGPLIRSLTAVPVPGHEYHAPSAFGPDARVATDVTAALRSLPADGAPVLICGSLYLAGDVLRVSGMLPD